MFIFVFINGKQKSNSMCTNGLLFTLFIIDGKEQKQKGFMARISAQAERSLLSARNRGYTFRGKWRYLC